METDIIAINVLLKPDQAMRDVSRNYNQRLIDNYKQGFRFDNKHLPHITLFQLFVRIKDLFKIENDVINLVREKDLSGIELKAIGMNYSPYNNERSVAIVVDKRPLLNFHNDLVESLKEYSVAEGTGRAFAPRPGGGSISKISVDYVHNFVMNSAGENYKSHLTLGIAQEEFAITLVSEPFDVFSFGISSVSICQIGQFGTAQNEICTFDV